MSREAFSVAAFPRLGLAPDTGERDRARLRGYADGHAEGMRAAHRAAHEAEARAAVARAAADDAAAVVAASAARALDVAVAALAEHVDSLATTAQDRVYALAVELAQAILEREISDPVRSALVAWQRTEAVTDAVDQPASVVVSTGDLATLERLSVLPSGAVLVASADLAPGDAVVRLTDGEVDLRVSAALDRARGALTEVR